MSLRRKSLGASALVLAASCYIGSAGAGPLLCEEAIVSHKHVEKSQLFSCLGGVTKKGTSSTFTLVASDWDSWSEIAIGFKLGKGNKPDRWFFHLLSPGVSNGSWQFVNVLSGGGGLSLVQLHSRTTNVPEPGTLALLGVGLLGAGIARRRKRT